MVQQGPMGPCMASLTARMQFSLGVCSPCLCRPLVLGLTLPSVSSL